MASITVYDGAESIGGNKIFVENGKSGVFLDFGKNFGKFGKYFEEFLKNRDTRGIHDQMSLGLIPRISNYRSDLIPPDMDISALTKLNIDAVLVSHAHADHVGNIGYLDRSIPVVASSLTISILKGMQDSGVSQIDNEISYVSERRPSPGCEMLLESDRSKPHFCKDFYYTDNPSGRLSELLSRRPGQEGKRAKSYECGKFGGIEEIELPFSVKAFDVDHSIFGASAYILEGDEAIAYTGDLRIHGKNEDKTKDFVYNGKDASILITEGTRVGRAGDENDSVNTSEHLVYKTCSEKIANEKCEDGLVIADFSPRNFERLESFLTIAEESGRDLVVTAKDLYLMHAMECADDVCRIDRLFVYDELTDKKNRKWETEVVQERCLDRYIDHTEIHKNPEKYILCFSFFDMKHLLDIKPDGGTYIYSSCEAFDEEMRIDFSRLWNWLNYFGIDVNGFSISRDENYNVVVDSVPGYHASGHASRDDLEWIIDTIDPEVIIPVHTTGHSWFLDNFEATVGLKDGEKYSF